MDDQNIGIDLQDYAAERGFPSGNLVTYYAVGVESPEDQDATLLIGSEDGVKVWLNGKLVHSNFVRRSPAFAQDVVSVKLKKGTNVLLVKLEQITGGGGLIVAVRVRSKVTIDKP